MFVNSSLVMVAAALKRKTTPFRNQVTPQRVRISVPPGGGNASCWSFVSAPPLKNVAGRASRDKTCRHSRPIGALLLRRHANAIWTRLWHFHVKHLHRIIWWVCRGRSVRNTRWIRTVDLWAVPTPFINKAHDNSGLVAAPRRQ